MRGRSVMTDQPESRREFVARLAALGASASLPAAWQLLAAVEADASEYERLKGPVEAEYYRKGLRQTAQCDLCPHAESLAAGQLGFCRTRRNVDGVLKTYAWNQPCVLNVDPIERNPACHVLPGRKLLTIAHAGCNMRCQYCQNW